MKNRRHFLKHTTLWSAALLLRPFKGFSKTGITVPRTGEFPMIISTWNHGLPANKAAWETLENGGTVLDAVEAGVRIPEGDPENTSVGLGGFPDRDGKVTLDACISAPDGKCGSVSFLQHIVHPVSVARKVMEDTPHVMLSGEGALEFALEKGFKKTNLLTPKAENAWKEWLKKSDYQPVINIENHDTIGMLAIDKNGDIAGACTTSGLAFKMHGRVGDSPVIGAGLFVDNSVGGAVATGLGEAVMRIAGSAIVVELMRHGHSPEDACREAVNRIIANEKEPEKLQVGFLALNKKGEYGAFAIHPGFNFALKTGTENRMIDAAYGFGK